MSIADIREQIMELPDARFLIEEMKAELINETINRKRFYEWITEDHKAEFINGHIITQSPVKLKHLGVNMNLSSAIHYHAKKERIGKVFSEKAMISLTRNDYEPDICFFRQEIAQDFEPNTMLFPAPDFVVEILSKSTAKIDRGVKKRDYALHNVTEYWIIDADKQMIEQYLLDPEADEKTYAEPIIYKLQDSIKSHAITGFEIALKDIFG